VNVPLVLSVTLKAPLLFVPESTKEEDRVPACVSTCPAHARHFGDLGDENSAVSQLVRERGGYDLMPELGYRPTNKYLPPRERKQSVAGCDAHLKRTHGGTAEKPTQGVLRWIDSILSR